MGGLHKLWLGLHKTWGDCIKYGPKRRLSNPDHAMGSAQPSQHCLQVALLSHSLNNPAISVQGLAAAVMQLAGVMEGLHPQQGVQHAELVAQVKAATGPKEIEVPMPKKSG